MKTAIIYGTKHGGTLECVKKLEAELPEEVVIYAIKDNPKINLDDFDTIIIGGSIHAGGIQKEIKSFCKENEAQLITKNLGLFICSGMQLATEFEHNFSAELLAASKVHNNLGYINNIQNFNFLERTMMKLVPKDSIKAEGIYQDKLKDFVLELTK